MIKVRLQTIQGQLLSEQVISNFPATLGRDASSSIVLNESGVSGSHAELDWDGQVLTVRDLGSRNGTFVEKERITLATVNIPCSIVLGSQVLMEVEKADSAVLARAEKLAPKPLKRPVRQTPPIPVQAEPVVKDIEIIEGWERYWHQLKNLPPRPVLLAMIGLAGAFALLHLIVFRESFLLSVAIGIGAASGCAIVSALLAAVLALPGILFRGSYDIKPLFIQCCVCSMVMTIQLAVLRPAMLMDYFGVLAQMLSLPLILAASLPGAYVFLFTTFSHKHAKRLAVASMIFAAAGIFIEGRKVFNVDRQALMREALLGEFRGTRGLAGSATGVKSVTDDIRAFGRKVTPQ